MKTLLAVLLFASAAGAQTVYPDGMTPKPEHTALANAHPVLKLNAEWTFIFYDESNLESEPYPVIEWGEKSEGVACTLKDKDQIDKCEVSPNTTLEKLIQYFRTKHSETQGDIDTLKLVIESDVKLDDERRAEIEKLKKRIAQLEHELKQEDRLKHEEVPMWNVWCAAGTQKACVACPTDKNGNPVCYPPEDRRKK